MNVDDLWFSELRGVSISELLDPAAFDDQKDKRTHWTASSKICVSIRHFCETRYYSKSRSQKEKIKIIMWQVFLHVVNHGRDFMALVLDPDHVILKSYSRLVYHATVVLYC